MTVGKTGVAAQRVLAPLSERVASPRPTSEAGWRFRAHPRKRLASPRPSAEAAGVTAPVLGSGRRYRAHLRKRAASPRLSSEGGGVTAPILGSGWRDRARPRKRLALPRPSSEAGGVTAPRQKRLASSRPFTHMIAIRLRRFPVIVRSNGRAPSVRPQPEADAGRTVRQHCGVLFAVRRRGRCPSRIGQTGSLPCPPSDAGAMPSCFKSPP